MADPNNDTIETLNDLIHVCEDGQKGFQAAAEAVKDPRYKDLYRRNSAQRAAFVSELQSEVRRLGGKPDDSGTAAGAMHRGWINLRTALSGKDEKAVVSECERGEDHAVKAYRDATAQALLEPARSIVSRQSAEVLRAHDTMRALRNAEKAADA